MRTPDGFWWVTKRPYSDDRYLVSLTLQAGDSRSPFARLSQLLGPSPLTARDACRGCARVLVETRYAISPVNVTSLASVKDAVAEYALTGRLPPWDACSHELLPTTPTTGSVVMWLSAGVHAGRYTVFCDIEWGPWFLWNDWRDDDAEAEKTTCTVRRQLFAADDWFRTP